MPGSMLFLVLIAAEGINLSSLKLRDRKQILAEFSPQMITKFLAPFQEYYVVGLGIPQTVPGILSALVTLSYQT